MLEFRIALCSRRCSDFEAIYAGLADQRIVTTLCPGGKERMRRLMTMVATGRVDLTPLVSHGFALEDLKDAYDVFSHQREGVMKVAIYPQGVPSSERATPETVSAIL